MMTRIHGKIVFECDECGDDLETEKKDFDEALEVLRGEDWIARKVDDEWVHYCPSCAVS